MDSFRKMEAWVKELKSFLSNEIPIMIAGNKCDLPQRAIDIKIAEKYAMSVNSKLFETSAKTGAGVD